MKKCEQRIHSINQHRYINWIYECHYVYSRNIQRKKEHRNGNDDLTVQTFLSRVSMSLIKMPMSIFTLSLKGAVPDLNI